MSWTNADGLLVLFGNEQGQLGRAGEYNKLGPEHHTQIVIDLTDLTTSEQILSPTVTIPNGAVIMQVDVTVDEVATSASSTANLDLGLIDQDRTTEIDYDGLLAKADVWLGSAIGTKTEYVVGTTEVGALVGTPLTNTGLLSASYDTDAYTAGEIIVDIYWYMPQTVPNL